MKGVPEEAVRDASLITVKTGTLHTVILHKYYKKLMANPVPNIRQSATPESQKVPTAVNELMRRIKTTSRDLPPTVIERISKEYIEELREGGYSLEWR